MQPGRLLFFLGLLKITGASVGYPTVVTKPISLWVNVRNRDVPLGNGTFHFFDFQIKGVNFTRQCIIRLPKGAYLVSGILSGNKDNVTTAVTAQGGVYSLRCLLLKNPPKRMNVEFDWTLPKDIEKRPVTNIRMHLHVAPSALQKIMKCGTPIEEPLATASKFTKPTKTSGSKRRLRRVSLSGPNRSKSSNRSNAKKAKLSHQAKPTKSKPISSQTHRPDVVTKDIRMRYEIKNAFPRGTKKSDNLEVTPGRKYSKAEDATLFFLNYKNGDKLCIIAVGELFFNVFYDRLTCQRVHAPSRLQDDLYDWANWELPEHWKCDAPCLFQWRLRKVSLESKENVEKLSKENVEKLRKENVEKLSKEIEKLIVEYTVPTDKGEIIKSDLNWVRREDGTWGHVPHEE